MQFPQLPISQMLKHRDTKILLLGSTAIIVLALLFYVGRGLFLQTSIVPVEETPVTIETDMDTFVAEPGKDLTVKFSVKGNSTTTPLMGLKLILQNVPSYVKFGADSIKLAEGVTVDKAVIQASGEYYVLLLYGMKVERVGELFALTGKVENIPENAQPASVMIFNSEEADSRLVSQIASLNSAQEYTSYSIKTRPLLQITSKVSATSSAQPTTTASPATSPAASATPQVSASPSPSPSASATPTLQSPSGSLPAENSATPCSYPSASAGCSYVAGPYYVAATGCGMILQCSTPAPDGFHGAAASPTPVANTNLSVFATTDKTAVQLNDIVSYTINVKNLSVSPISGIKLEDALPDSLSYISHTPNDRCNYISGKLTCDFEPIPAKETRTVTMKAKVVKSQNFTNSAVVIAPNMAPLISSVAHYVGGIADMSVKNAVLDTSYPMNRDFSYRVTIKNAGPVQATGIKFEDTVPSGISFLSVQPSTNCSVLNTKIVCSVADLDAQRSAIYTITVRGNTQGTFANTATIRADQSDPNQGDNTDTAQITITPNISVTSTPLQSSTPLPTSTPAPTVSASSTPTPQATALPVSTDLPKTGPMDLVAVLAGIVTLALVWKGRKKTL